MKTKPREEKGCEALASHSKCSCSSLLTQIPSFSLHSFLSITFRSQVDDFLRQFPCHESIYLLQQSGPTKALHDLTCLFILQF